MLCYAFYAILCYASHSYCISFIYNCFILTYSDQFNLIILIFTLFLFYLTCLYVLLVEHVARYWCMLSVLFYWQILIQLLTAPPLNIIINAFQSNVTNYLSISLYFDAELNFFLSFCTPQLCNFNHAMSNTQPYSKHTGWLTN